MIPRSHAKNQTFLITGTDTGVGKTHCTLVLMRALQAQGLRVAGMKPVACGCETTATGLRNEDAEALLQQSALAVPYDQVNPYAFAPPIAPHLAAEAVGQTVELVVIIEAYRQLRAQADTVLVEGAGGWRVPLNRTQDFRHLAQVLEAQVILVVGLRLGCINHALLSAECIVRDGLPLYGWIANPIDSDFEAAGSVETLRRTLDAPLLALESFIV